MFVVQKPLRRIEVEEIGEDEEEVKRRRLVTSAQAAQSETKQRVTSEDYAAFDRLMGAGDSASASGETDVASRNGHHTPKQDSPRATTDSSSPKSSKTLVTDQSPEVQTAAPTVPGVPSTSYQFQADYARLKPHPDLFYQYFKVSPRILVVQTAVLVGNILFTFCFSKSNLHCFHACSVSHSTLMSSTIFSTFSRHTTSRKQDFFQLC